MTWTIIAAILGSGVLSTLISCIFTAVSEKRKEIAAKEHKSDSVVIALRQLFYGRIKRYAREYLSRKWITSEELSDIIEDHRIYHDVLGGNGFLDDIMDKVKQLEIRD